MKSRRITTRPIWTGDDKDLAIVAFLLRNPQARVAEIAGSLDVSLPTVHRRLTDMFDSEVIERGVRVRDWGAIGYPLRYWVDIRANHRALQEKKGGPPGNRQIDSPKKLAQHIM